MRLLLDTQAFLWWLSNPDRFNPQAIELLENPSHECYFSSVSSWEIAIKYSIGKLPLPHAPAVYIAAGMKRGGFNALPVQHEHTYRAAKLPLHHKDPFDRLLVCQAQVEGLMIVTSDPAMELYDVRVIRVD